MRNGVPVQFDRYVIAFVLIGGLGAVVAFMTATIRVIIAKTQLHGTREKYASQDGRQRFDTLF